LRRDETLEKGGLMKCGICGNERDPSLGVCKFCNATPSLAGGEGLILRRNTGIKSRKEVLKSDLLRLKQLWREANELGDPLDLIQKITLKIKKTKRLIREIDLLYQHRLAMMGLSRAIIKPVKISPLLLMFMSTYSQEAYFSYLDARSMADLMAANKGPFQQ